MTVRQIPPWFVKQRGHGWRITGRGWLALLVLAALVAGSVLMLRGIERVVLTSLIVMGFIALSVGKVDMRRLGLE